MASDTITLQYTAQQLMHNLETERRHVHHYSSLAEKYDGKIQALQKKDTLQVKQLKMAQFLALLNNSAEFKRFAALCGDHITAKDMDALKCDMIKYPDEFLRYCTQFKENEKKEKEEKKKTYKRKRSADANNGANDEDEEVLLTARSV